ncbi:MAG: hypothetical protein CMG75_04485 [Candidatus Marinimicrobia bacterium]|nr:hypothetical protein [Candidatus Neomarinimicrobiota bacterium]
MIRYIKLIFVSIPFLILGQDTSSIEWSPVIEKQLIDNIAINENAKEIYNRIFIRLRNGAVPINFFLELSKIKEITVDKTVVQRFNRPAEKLSYERYRKIFINDSRIRGGVNFYKENKALLDNVSSIYGVDPFLLVSLSGVESNYGANSKTHSVFNALHTVIHNLPRKAKWVEKEMAEYLIYCWENEIPPLSLYGSYAGAFGYGQFIPSSFRAYAVDFDRDGIREPFEWPDVLASMANYLVKNGYSLKENNFSKDSPNWKSIYRYNPSENYVNVILDLRTQIMKNID